jgi:hypothetical protein
MGYQKGLGILGIMAASAVTAFGAPPNEEQAAVKKPGEVAETKSVEERTAWRNGDHFLASCIAIDNQEEVALSQWAQDKLQNAEAKEFAKMLVKDHSAFLAKLQRFAPEATQEHFLTSTTSISQEVRATGQKEDRNPAARREERRRERAENKAKDDSAGDDNPRDQANRKAKGTIQQVVATTETNETGNLQVDLMQLHREIAEQCLADTKEMLTAKSAEEFDACFIGLQIARHAAMKTKLTVCERHATGELKDLLSKATATTSDHLDHAQKLMKELAPEVTKTAATK